MVRHADEEKPDYGNWLLPAGKLESGEGLEDALKREIKEEVGLRIRIMRKLLAHTDPYTGDELINFLCVPITSRMRTSSELMKARRFNVNEIRGLENIHPGLKRFLIDLLSGESFT